jgi:NADH:ubiquinone oxidoreductase subunit 5 (subunit L)/multisubunit Na+/H+ antiporter MnhA subunit
MENTILLLPVFIPAILSIFIFILPKKDTWLKEAVTLIGATVNLAVCILLFGKEAAFTAPWIAIGGFKIDFLLRLYHFSSFIILAVSVFAFLIAMYSAIFMRGRENLRMYYGSLLITVGFVNGAVLANHLILMLFFWEGLLITLFTMIMTGGKGAFPTAVKAFVLNGVADFCMILGIALMSFIAKGELAMDILQKSPISLNDFWGIFAFILVMIGAVAKAGSMPFHTWIPDAALDAPLPFMAFLPASLEKLLGIYFLARITLDLFDFRAGSAMSIVVMTIGAVTILFAVMMALIQKNFKKLLSYHAISQVGYMILGIGTAIPVGIVGGLFHMINHAMYKSCLFLTGGSVEKQAGTTELKDLGGLGRKMPVTFICFVVAASAISGVPPFNGFFSKELVFDGALESHIAFYIAAVLGAFLTAASFLKLGHAAFLGKQNRDYSHVKDPGWAMLVPMIVIASGCVLFGVYNPLPLNGLIQPILGARIEHSFAGLPGNWTLVLISVGVLVLAFLNHLYGAWKTKSGLGAVDHIYHAPILSSMYKWAELGYFDPYTIGMIIVNGASRFLWWIDKGIDWLYNRLTVGIVSAFSYMIGKAHTGSYQLYLLWSLAGLAVIIIIFVFQLR